MYSGSVGASAVTAGGKNCHASKCGGKNVQRYMREVAVVYDAVCPEQRCLLKQYFLFKYDSFF